MSKKNSLCIALSVALLTACGSTPKNSAVDQARSDYQIAQTNPQIGKYAQLELKQAGDALHVAENALNERQDTDIVNHFAYIAKQKVAIADETARLRLAEDTIQHADSQRAGVLLDARTTEANLANQKVQQLERELNAKNSDRGLVITLGDVLFDTDQAQLKSGGLRTLQKLSEFLKENNERKVVIEGFTDSTGSEEYNLNLSERRAATVKNALLDLGISSDRIISRGYGKSYPVAGNDTAAGRQLNRRVEIIVSKNASAVTPR